MTDRIALHGIAVTACHGVLDFEKTQPQRFIADVVLETDLATAGAGDDLVDTVSYAEVAQETVAILSGPPVDLIETLAARISDAALAHTGVEAVEVTIHKPDAPAGVHFVDGGGPSVSIRRETDRPAVIALGANLGDRLGTLTAAVRAVSGITGLRIVRVSPLVETDPIGPEQPDYLNAVLLARTRLAPASLLRELHRIEAEFGRVRETRWGARSLDLDLIQVADLMADTPALTLPHPRAHERAFVLQPWLLADPDATLLTPEGARPVAALLEALPEQGVRPGPDWPGGVW
ncbi:2-amino-4-hydroxy-6-hydroxymethyldihydropteridine diphosphokinase [Branchiibius sp. NY16-3462-2]|uniref:2-amino-4-hydroxy-6- hydroxymethyldihydropteridine diphosphokinase n=1 Tax=Branchiibius sp. NY16-3462-2 TaxID=1807500 RepID=UPI0007970E8F|nr:2-amino-4-hydroxy-6-hydroxymethyldihydropteridine diphosphokinase [Branchiibius sp. NY16-3462-2]KYH46272.1 2-amino-4-hydroxy-6-hydroxymethyldihydropteridine pyrophosphokinase [Branchiibius sp. NY16-3462-2]